MDLTKYYKEDAETLVDSSARGHLTTKELKYLWTKYHHVQDLVKTGSFMDRFSEEKKMVDIIHEYLAKGARLDFIPSKFKTQVMKTLMGMGIAEDVVEGFLDSLLGVNSPVDEMNELVAYGLDNMIKKFFTGGYTAKTQDKLLYKLIQLQGIQSEYRMPWNQLRSFDEGAKWSEEVELTKRVLSELKKVLPGMNSRCVDTKDNSRDIMLQIVPFEKDPSMGVFSYVKLGNDLSVGDHLVETAVSNVRRISFPVRGAQFEKVLSENPETAGSEKALIFKFKLTDEITLTIQQNYHYGRYVCILLPN